MDSGTAIGLATPAMNSFDLHQQPAVILASWAFGTFQPDIELTTTHSQSLLHRWEKKSEEGKADPFPGKGRLSPEDEELRQLRRENRRLRMERDILKKAVAIFSEEPQ